MPNSLSGRVIHGVRNSWCNRDRGKLPQALHTDRARFLVEVTHKKNVECWDIRGRRYEIAGIIAVEEAAHYWIGFRFFKQSLSYAPDDPADGLATCGLWIDDPAAVIGAHKAVESGQSKFGIDMHLGEYRREAEGCLRSFCHRIVVSIAGQRRKIISREQRAVSDI